LQLNTAGGSKFKARGAAVLNDRLANDVCQQGMDSSGTHDNQVMFNFSCHVTSKQ